MSKVDDLMGLLGGQPSSPNGERDKAQSEKIRASLRKMLQQAVDGERRALKRAVEAEADVDRVKRRAQNNIDRAFNRGVAAAGGDDTVRRIVRHPEFGTS